MQALELKYNSEIELNVTEASKLKGCSERHLRRLIDSGELRGEKRLNERNRPVYYIPLSALDTKEQDRYHKQHGISGQVIELPQRNAKPLDTYSKYERKQISFWLDLLDEWQLYRNKPIHASRAAADNNFVTYALVKYIEEFQSLYDRPFTLSTDTLYRRWRAYKNKDYDGLIEKRGKPLKGVTTMQDIVWDCFLSFYLDQAQYSIQKCYEYTQMWLQEKQPELLETLPTYSTFYRRVQNDIPEPLEVLGRKGEKAYRDRCAPYIRRIYDDMESNDYWVGDTYTLDTMSLDENGNEHRRYLVAFFDARSGVIVGWHITTQPSSQATLIALRKAILKYGIPKNVYVDNGREFLTFDLGGLGHRKKKLKNDAERFEPPAIFQRLGITMVNALVRNARAKVIERRFRDVKEHIARLFPSYTGGNITERPEQLILRVREESMVISASEVMLPEHGKDRNMPRLLGESAEGYRRRLSMKAIIAEKAGTREGILLALAALGYENAEIKSYRDIDPDRWAEFIVALGTGTGQAVRDLAVIYQEILLVKQASSKPAYLLFTDNDPFNDTLMLGTDVSSYAELTLNYADELILVRDMEFNSPLYAAVITASYSETILNSADDPILTPNRSFDIPLNFSIVATSYKEELLQ